MTTNGDTVAHLLGKANELRLRACRARANKELGTMAEKLALDQEDRARQLEREAENLARVARRIASERFTGVPLSLKYDGIQFWLGEDASYRTALNEITTVRTGFVTDFASIPRFFMRLFPRPGDGRNKYGIAAVWHDWLYVHGQIEGKPITRKRADDIFLEIMRYVHVEEWVALLFYGGVRLGSGWIWKRYRKSEVTSWVGGQKN